MEIGWPNWLNCEISENPFGFFRKFVEERW